MLCLLVNEQNHQRSYFADSFTQIRKLQIEYTIGYSRLWIALVKSADKSCKRPDTVSE